MGRRTTWRWRNINCAGRSAHPTRRTTGGGGHRRAGATREFVTTFGLALPGARVSLKVFVILDTGNESGSATVVIQRPV